MRWRANSAEETEQVGAQLARSLPRRDCLLVVYLEGDLGAGKTTLVRGFVRACGVTGSVKSPTYTLLELYETPGGSVLHADLYRLRDPAELENIGLREWARPGFVWLVEWPERGLGHLPPADLSMTLHAGFAHHEISATAHSAVGMQWLAALNPLSG